MHLPVGLALVDYDGGIQFANAAALKLFASSDVNSARNVIVKEEIHVFDQTNNRVKGSVALERLFPHSPNSEVFESTIITPETVSIVRARVVGVHRSTVLVSYEDVTQSTQTKRVTETRERLLHAAEAHSLSELLQLLLDEVEGLTQSRFALFVALGTDQNTTLSWISSHATAALVYETPSDLECSPVPAPTFSKDCVRKQAFVIRNDCTLQSSSTESVNGHLLRTRELAVPIIRNSRVVAILELYNKPFNYTTYDAQVATQTADYAWDIIEKKRSEELLHRSHTALNGSLNAVVVTDVELKITYLNPAFLKLFRLPHSREQLGRSLLDYWQDPTLAERVFREMFEDGFSAGELYGRREDGSNFLVEFTGSCIRDRDGNSLGLFATFIDVTDYHRVQTGLRDAEEKFSGAFHVISDSVHITDYVTNKIIEVNEGFERGSGYSRQEVIGKTTIQLNLWADPIDRQTYFAKLAKQGYVRGFQARFRTKDGRILWAEHSSDFLQLSGRRCLVTITRDVTAQRAAAIAIEESEQRFRNMFDLHDAAMLLIDPENGEIHSANAAAELYFGTERGCLVERRIDEICTISPSESSLLLKAAVSGTTKAFGLRHRDQSGNIREAEVYASPIHHLGQTVLYAILHDVTERRKLEEQVRRVQRMDCLGNLASGVAHDINNVLSAILAHATVQCEESPKGSELADDLSTIVQACIRGRTLVRSLLDFARPKLSNQQIMSLNALVEDEVRLLSRTTLSKISLKLDLEPNLHSISGDSSALGHALMNLCINAVDAMANGGTLTIVTRNLSSTKVELRVCDTGHGMSQEVLEKALDPFFSTKPQGKGTGLGLPMVYSAAEAHAAQLEIMSTEGHGTAVSLTFPTVDAPIEEAPESQVGRFFVESLSILVVDDDWIVLRGLARQLTRLGHHVTPCTHGMKAIQLLEMPPTFDLVVVDVNMPDISGCDVYNRSREGDRHCPFLFVTGRPDEALQQFIAEHPQTEMLAKPFTQSELKESLRKICNSSVRTGVSGIRPRRVSDSTEVKGTLSELTEDEFRAR
jgi:PAS domain S-box-containing protein